MNRFGFRMVTVISLGVALLGSAAAQQGVIPAAAKQSDLDQPLEWLQEARRNYTAVKDYTCTLVTQENVRGKLQDKSIINLKIKAEPFSVHMRWLEPEKSLNQEVIFVQGKNNNKMRVKSNLVLAKSFFVSIDTNDKRVTEHSRHTILEAGIGNMIEQHISQWEKDRQIGKTIVKTEDYVCYDRKCIRIELTRTAKNPAFYCHRTVIFLEKESKLPILLENYDWPTADGPEGGELLEKFGYVRLQFNVGLKDADFNK